MGPRITTNKQVMKLFGEQYINVTMTLFDNNVTTSYYCCSLRRRIAETVYYCWDNAFKQSMGLMYYYYSADIKLL